MKFQTDFSMGVHGARGLFAFAVLIYHVANSGLPSWELPSPVENFLLSFKFGVELFFAISGFVILGTVQRAATPSQFLINRATRIFPVLWAAVLTITVLYVVGGVWSMDVVLQRNFSPWLVANMLALPGIFDLPLFLPPAWTLSYELTFYLLCYVYLVLHRHLHLNAALPLLLFGLVLITFYPRGLFFLSGLLVGASLIRGRVPLFVSRFPGALLLVFLIAWQTAAFVTTPTSGRTEKLFDTMWDWTNPAMIPLTMIALVAATLMLQGIADGQGWFGGRFLQSRPMIWLGTVSYSLYLWHPIVLGIVKAGMRTMGLPDLLGNWSQLAFFCLAAPPSLLVAHYSQVILERRATKVLRNAWTGLAARGKRPKTDGKSPVKSPIIETPTDSRDV